MTRLNKLISVIAIFVLVLISVLLVLFIGIQSENPRLRIDTNSSLNYYDYSSDQISYPIENEQYLVTRVVDGDNIYVLMNGIEENVRLLGIDAPELNHPTIPRECFAQEAKSFLENNLLNKYVVLEEDTIQPSKDRYGRNLRHVWIIDSDSNVYVNELMILRGYAELYTSAKNTYYKVLENSQEIAMDNGVGIWSNGCNIDSVIENLDDDFVCDCTKSCSNMLSCEEAYFQLACGCTARDGNGDGIPCNDLCN